MKLKKKSLFITSILFALALMIMPNLSKASTQLEPPLYLGVQEYRTNTDPANMAYAIGNPDRNGETPETMVGAKLWDIVEYKSDSEQDKNYDNSKNYFCVKAGVGFRNPGEKATYNISYDFKNEREEILKSNNDVIKSLVNIDNDTYYNIMALADLMYLPGVSTEEDKQALLEAADIHIPEEFTLELTDTDIEAIEQAALWYFTNYDDEIYDTVYNQYGKPEDENGWFTYKIQGMDQYYSLSDYGKEEAEKEGEQRQRQAVKIYNYLIETAKINGQKYKDGTAESNTKITLYAHSTITTNQPIIVIEKLPEEEKEFDMALRKYITKINGIELSSTNTRIPQIDEGTLQTSTTATYKHRKDPVTVKTGDTVTYNITVYNEGEKEGRVTKIVDQLPTGLEYVKINTPGFTGTYNQDTNQVTIERQENNQTNLAPYEEGNLQSETIEIECKVTEKPDANNRKILTNVAYIKEEYDSEDGVTITNQEGLDRDSTPEIIPEVNKDNMEDYKGTTTEEDLSQNIYYPGQEDDDDFEKLVLEPQSFDLKLIKRIVEVNGTAVPERIENVDVSKLNTQDSEGNKITTAEYTLNKEPVSVKKGDIVKYTIRVYNEGDIAGYAQEISEDIPEGLEFLWSEKTDEELESDETLTEAEKEAIKYNQGIWDIKEINTETGRIEMISTDYLAKGKGEELIEEGANLIKGFDQTKGYINTINEKNPDYKEVSVYMEVVSENQTGTIIRNEAAVTEDADEEGNPVDDRDSSPEEWVKYEDDEDYDNVKLQVFDLSLRKFIIAVSPDEEINEEDYLKNEDGTYSRAPQVDTSTLNTIDSEGNMITTAIYNHPKTPVEVNTNDYVIYNLRVYNEGEIAGYAEKITDYLPEELEFVEGEFNNQYGWEVSEDGRKVETNYLQNSIIEGIKTDEEGNIILSYKEVPIMCKVKENTEANKNLSNIAEITEYKDENKNDITDRDSEENNVNLPEDENLPTYKDDETGEYIPGQEDDDDFEKVVIKPFDLALRKFITGVNSEEVGTRIPQVKYDKETNKITYEHTKEPVEVVTGNTVIYTIRVYNEGEKAGFARKVADDIPEGLEFLPENSINQEYRWVMYDSKGNVTENVEEAEKIVTDYLSKAHGEEMMEENGLEENPNLLKPFDKEAGITDSNPDYRDVKVAFRVIEPETSDRIVINSAQIEEDEDKNGDEVEDIDSIPGEWNEGEDDQDKEYVKVTYFDLSLRKWVTEAIVIEDGKETITQTGHTAEMDPEPVVKVELHRKKLDEVTVKFRYKIRVTNEGNIAGYAKEITDYVPEGLRFIAEDNPGWTDEGNNIISTRLLENTLLEPGESAEVEVLLTWINGNNNLGLKTNTAEISEDYNDKDVPDIDSTPDNKKPGEDDIDIAEVILSISTGGAKIYYVLGFTVLLTLAGGIIIIKKFVL